MLVLIREEECIGCTKCIGACPVDAIIGSNKKMHTVIAADCIGCKLCIPACPVDCIEELPLAEKNKPSATYLQSRYRAKKKRESEKAQVKPPMSEKAAYLAAAVQRIKNKV